MAVGGMVRRNYHPLASCDWLVVLEIALGQDFPVLSRPSDLSPHSTVEHHNIATLEYASPSPEPELSLTSSRFFLT